MVSRRTYYNEPFPDVADRIPDLPDVEPKTLPATVQTRLFLESELRVCGLTRPTPGSSFTASQRRVLLTMLREADSPLSASLRLRATAAAGAARLTEAIPQLRSMALDDDEDLSTRLAAIDSYVSLAQVDSSRDVAKLLQSGASVIRHMTYVSVARHAPNLTPLALEYFARENDPAFRTVVQRKTGFAAEGDSTVEDA